METMFGYQSASAQFKEEIKKLLKKHLLLQWMKSPEKKWVTKL
jgi:hypothetical protein